MLAGAGSPEERSDGSSDTVSTGRLDCLPVVLVSMSDGVGRVGLPRRALLTGTVVVGLIVAAGFVLGLDPLLAMLADADPATFAFGLVGIVAAVACWGEAQRRLLVAAGASLSTPQGFLGYGAGMFAKQVLPAGHALGSGLVAYVFRSVTRRSYGETSATLSAARTALLVVGGGLGLLVSVAWYRRETVTASVHGVAWLVRGTVGRVSGRIRDAVSAPAVAGTIGGSTSPSIRSPATVDRSWWRSG